MRGAIWIVLIGVIVVALLYGDMRGTPQHVTATDTRWSHWTSIEPANGRIRVLWIDQDYVPFVNAGSEICSHKINKFLMDKPYKFDVWVATPNAPARATYDGIRCFNLNDTKTLLEVLHSSHVLNSHSYYYREQMIYLCRITGIPFVGWAHSDNYVQAVKRDCSAWVDPRCAAQQWTAFNSNSLRDSVGADVPNSDVFIPVVDYREYAVPPEKHERRYVTLSNVNENKGGQLLIDLARALPDMEFLGVIGGYWTQITTDTLPNLTYIPHTDDIQSVYSKTWVQIMPSRKETWGRTAVEAMASGIPLIVSPTPGLRECCGDAALYIDRRDVAGWTTALRTLKSDRAFYDARSKLCLARAHALDPQPVCERIATWLETTVVPSRAAGRPLTALEKNLLFR
jgi:glycosyltransferase involved in cell wall biosynthesis